VKERTVEPKVTVYKELKSERSYSMEHNPTALGPVYQKMNTKIPRKKIYTHDGKSLQKEIKIIRELNK